MQSPDQLFMDTNACSSKQPWNSSAKNARMARNSVMRRKRKGNATAFHDEILSPGQPSGATITNAYPAKGLPEGRPPFTPIWANAIPRGSWPFQVAGPAVLTPPCYFNPIPIQLPPYSTAKKSRMERMSAMRRKRSDNSTRANDENMVPVNGHGVPTMISLMPGLVTHTSYISAPNQQPPDLKVSTVPAKKSRMERMSAKRRKRSDNSTLANDENMVPVNTHGVPTMISFKTGLMTQTSYIPAPNQRPLDLKAKNARMKRKSAMRLKRMGNSATLHGENVNAEQLLSISADKGISRQGHKRLKLSSNSLPYSAHDKAVPEAPAISDVPNRLQSGKFGSVTKDTEALIPRKMQLLGPFFAKYPKPFTQSLKVAVNHGEESNKLENKKSTVMSHEKVYLEEESIKKDASAAQPVVIIDSDDRDEKSSLPFNEVMLPKSLHSPALNMIDYRAPTAYHGKSEDLPTLAAKDNTQRDKGVYVGVQEEEDHEVDTEDDGLDDIWREMSMAVECSKDVSVNPLPEEEVEKDDDCDHSFLLKDDLGYVCRVCGVIDRGIETIFDFQYKVKSSSTWSRTYKDDSWNAKAKADVCGVKIAEDDIMLTEISAHPRHMKQMKSHQIEGFNFLVRNLVGDNPGGCILAHAPGSGKTFMIISFMQSFLGKYPNARPLVVLPKGILSTWKKEFQTWQVEDIPLYDFYTVKADSRSQQLEVLKQWVEHKSILFLGYKQFSSIVCDNSTNSVSISCQDVLLKVPSILILDEGHNPRNENTNMVHSLAKVRTQRKVVLSGTLYQNHVKEVFNILNLVRPKFLKMETSRPIVKRIHSRVHIPGKNTFFDLVEDTLQKDPDFKRKIAVIQDLREMTSKVLHYYKGDFLDELPGLVDFTVLLNLTPSQKHEIEKLKNISRKFKVSSMGSALYLHPRLKPVAEECGENCVSDQMVDDLIEKLDVKDGVKSKFFMNILNLCESSGEKLLVFSQYLLPLKYLERLTWKRKGWSVGKEIFGISGESSSEQREWTMERFNNSPDAKVFFGSIKACGEGISLVGASRVLILDVHLNPSVTRQAIGRAFRPGQTKKVFVYRLIAADSPEEEDHITSFKKELISKMWFEWNEYCGDRAFQVETTSAKECGDLFLESPMLGENIKALYKR